MAIDWSGRSGRDQRRFLWLAEAVDGELVRLEGGRTRAELVELLIAEANRDPNLIVGLDFAFSLPAWYLQERRLTPRQLWALLADEALTPAMRQLGLTRWKNRPELPFWITGEAHAQLAPAQILRRTEQEVRVPGVQPKSVFQLIGAGQVGRGSLHGMGALHRLAGVGFRIWPFDPSGLPLVVEIFPRVLTGPVRKNSPSERERYLGTVPVRPDLGLIYEPCIEVDLVLEGRLGESGPESEARPPERSFAVEGRPFELSRGFKCCPVEVGPLLEGHHVEPGLALKGRSGERGRAFEGRPVELDGREGGAILLTRRGG
jgi:hypothetical protein